MSKSLATKATIEKPIFDMTTETTPRAWQRMLSGRKLDLLNPSPDDIEIDDIAHGLARVARWNGQTLGAHAFSVAQHVVEVEQIAATENPEWPAKWFLAALLHDSAEYVIGDLISPFKNAIGLDYRTFEKKLLRAIHIRFSLPVELPEHVAEEIKRADRISAYNEATQLAGFTIEEARQFFGVPKLSAVQQTEKLKRLSAWPTHTAQQHFLARFRELENEAALTP